MSNLPLERVRVWDLPTRVFHWMLAASVIGSVITAKIGGNAMPWHFRLGYLALALLVFRIVWGFVGGRWSRFASFLYPPQTVLRYLRGDVRPGDHFEVGHNPMGSFSVYALITLLAVQVGTGLVSDDEIANIGPLNKLVAPETGLLATSWHKTWGQWILVTLILLHVCAILYYRFGKRTDLIGPMVSGDKLLPPDTPPAADDMRARVLAMVIAAAGVALAVWVMRMAP